MDPRLVIALAIHEGACRLMAAGRLEGLAVKASREAMSQIIPDFNDISFDLVYLLVSRQAYLNAAVASERLRHLAKDDTFDRRKSVEPTMTASEATERQRALAKHARSHS